MRGSSKDQEPEFLILNKNSINQFYLSLILKKNKEDIGVAINGFIGNFAVRQSLLRYSMSLELSIHDGYGLVDKSILKMGSVLELYFCRDPEHPKSAKLIKTFYVTNIDSSIQPLTQNERVYDITAYTFAGVSNAWPFSSVYRAGEKPSDIIKDIVKKKFTAKPEEVGVSNDVPELHWVPTENTLDTPTIFKQVAPFDAITNMLRRSTGPANDSTYFFYEDLEGFKLRTLGNMKPKDSPPPAIEYTMFPDKKPTGNTVQDFYKILYLTQHNNSDYFNILGSGVYSSEVVYIDFANRTIGNEGHVFDFESNTEYKDTILTTGKYEGFDIKSEVFERKGSPDPGAGFPEDSYDFTPASKIVFSEKAWDRIDYMHNKYPFDSAQRALFEQNKISIEVYGNPEIKPGDVITINTPRNHEEQEGVSRRISGTFLVTGVKHNVKANMFQTIVDLHKDGYEQNVLEGTKDNQSTSS